MLIYCQVVYIYILKLEILKKKISNKIQTNNELNWQKIEN